MNSIIFTVYGHAETAGSKQAFVPLHPKTKEPYRRPGGGIVVSTVDDNPKSKGWKKTVAKAAKEAYRGPLFEGPLIATFRFYRPRPKNHFAKFGLSKAGAQSLAPDTRPDVLKLARAAEDALNNPRKIQSTNPGYCFLMAGWKRCGVTKVNKLVILEKTA